MIVKAIAMSMIPTAIIVIPFIIREIRRDRERARKVKIGHLTMILIAALLIGCNGGNPTEVTPEVTPGESESRSLQSIELSTESIEGEGELIYFIKARDEALVCLSILNGYTRYVEVVNQGGVTEVRASVDDGWKWCRITGPKTIGLFDSPQYIDEDVTNDLGWIDLEGYANRVSLWNQLERNLECGGGITSGDLCEPGL